MNNRIIGIDSLRGIAALVVVFYHYLYWYGKLYENQEVQFEIVKYGFLGVQLFFIISGFVIFWSIQNLKNSTDFVVSRFSRLFPTYWSAIIITFCVVSFLGLPGREISLIDAAFNFLMIHKLFGVPNVDGVYWTLLAELLFYLFILTLILTNKVKHIEYFLLTIVIIAFSIKYIVFPNSQFIKQHITQPFVFFTIGICFYKIKARVASKLTLGLMAFSMVTSIWLYGPFTSIGLLLIYTVFSLVILDKLNFLNNRVLLFLGGISYPLYLVHQNVGYSILMNLESSGTPFLLAVLIAFISSVSLAFILHKCIEKPVTKSIRIFYKKRQKGYLLSKNPVDDI
jgi:peptidoglycan/LPS O-acetylase OafA/YrhL